MPDPLRQALERGGRGGVFFLHGDDEFRKEAAARLLLEAHLDPSTRDFNFDLLRGSEVDVERLASAIGTPPMMAEWRVVLLRETEALASSPRARDVLLAAAKAPPPGLALVLLATVPERSRAKFYRDLEARTRSFPFAAISSNDVPGWLVDRARGSYDVDMEEDAARALGAAIGTDLGVLAQELEKLVSFVGERGRIRREDVEAAGTRLPRQDRWQWFDMVGERRFREALDSLRTLLAQNETGVALVAGLGTHLLRLGVAADQGAAGLAAVLDTHQQWLSRRLVPQAKRWRREELERAVLGLLRVDRLLKASGLSDEALLEEWLLTRLAEAGEAA